MAQQNLLESGLGVRLCRRVRPYHEEMLKRGNDVQSGVRLYHE